MMKNIIKKGILLLVVAVLLSTSVFSNCTYAAAETQTTVDYTGKAVDNSQPVYINGKQVSYFPKIGNQSNYSSCCAWASTYYQFTRSMAKALNEAGYTYDVQDQGKAFSPLWNYSIFCGGDDNGGSLILAYDVLKDHGAVPCLYRPYIPYEEISLYWSPTIAAWRTALNYRLSKYTSLDLTYDNIDAAKQKLDEGYVLAIGAPSPDLCIYKKIQEGPHSGEKILIAAYDNAGAHAMVIVGYDDNIWIDLNENNIKEIEEVGAFKFANSWGDNYDNNGFIWVMYDALNAETRIPDNPTAYNYVSLGENKEWLWHNRCNIIFDCYYMDIDLSYSPKLYMDLCVSHSDRSQINLVVKSGGVTYTPTIFQINNNASRSCNFAGKQNGEDTAHFLFDITSLYEANGGGNIMDQNYEIEIIDQNKNDIYDSKMTKVHSINLIDSQNGIYQVYSDKNGQPLNINESSVIFNYHPELSKNMIDIKKTTPYVLGCKTTNLINGVRLISDTSSIQDTLAYYEVSLKPNTSYRIIGDISALSGTPSVTVQTSNASFYVEPSKEMATGITIDTFDMEFTTNSENTNYYVCLYATPNGSEQANIEFKNFQLVEVGSAAK